MISRLFLSAFLILSFSAFSQSGQAVSSVNTFMDRWHQAAAEANAAGFLDLMSENSVYIGTDSWEHWNKAEFVAFAKPYFDRGKAWTFHPISRDVHISPDGNLAWFSELLHTQMGICRASGVLSKKDDSWLVEQYHLSVTVPNELIDSFKELVVGKQKTEKP
ncbi:nuclear transport factor 2 family protein [Cytophagales bacterium LB-30]|uniref:Nuclear transport factor 2 family protein n=1 Tax=Shiella aurantiaca TaxID=3058365 RepID=A0ABT8F111_9BACT|nr:nuclear transport factor 2 family protein [Shiella aurantiaca]MDN4163916.1 nuclear transport factor 2 family protein [Shiella aurantiaca]